jgi:hypothetical protein
MEDGHPGKAILFSAAAMILTWLSSRKSVRLCSQQGRSHYLYCCVRCIGCRPYLAVLVSMPSPCEIDIRTPDSYGSRYNCWKLIGLHPLCAVLFTLGYALREYGAFHYQYSSHLSLIIYVLSQVFIYVCP